MCDGVQCGVVSYGNGCAEPGPVTVYSQVSHYVNWINAHKESK